MPQNPYYLQRHAETAYTLGDIHLAYKEFLRVVEMSDGLQGVGRRAAMGVRAVGPLSSSSTMLMLRLTLLAAVHCSITDLNCAAACRFTAAAPRARQDRFTDGKHVIGRVQSIRSPVDRHCASVGGELGAGRDETVAGVVWIRTSAGKVAVSDRLYRILERTGGAFKAEIGSDQL